MKLKRIYVDTSILGGYYDPEFDKETRMLFRLIKQWDINILYSSLVEFELRGAPEWVINVKDKIPTQKIINLSITPKFKQLARLYIKNTDLTVKSMRNALHIALATLNNADILVSWNFKHIVNVPKIGQFNEVNKKQGYKQIEIRSPKEIVYG